MQLAFLLFTDCGELPRTSQLFSGYREVGTSGVPREVPGEVDR